MNQSLELLSNRTQVVAPVNVTADRYTFLGLDQAEPNLGVAPTSAYVLATNEYGVRRWAPFNDVGVVGPTGPTGATGATGPTGDRYTTISTDTFAIPVTFPSYLQINVEPLLAYIPAHRILVAYNSKNYFTGTVVDYNNISGLMQLSALSAGQGSGTYSFWEVSLDGSVGGPQGSTGATGNPGPVGASYFPNAISYYYIEPSTATGKAISGSDQYGRTLTYNALLPNNVNVYKNGSRLTNNFSFTANDGVNILLASSLIASDKIEVVVVSGSIDFNPDIFTRNDLQNFRYTVGFDPLTSIPTGYYTVSGFDDTNRLLAYTPGSISLYKNGSHLIDTLDYTATNGYTITLSGQLNTTDVVNVLVLSAFNFAPYKVYYVSQVLNYFYTVPTAGIPVGAVAISGVDTYGKTLDYFPQAVDVFVNGVNLVNVADFAATDGKNVILNVPLLYGDTIQIKTLSAFGTQPAGPTGPTGATGATGGERYNATSSSTVTIPTTINKYVSFALNETNLSYIPSQSVLVSHDLYNTMYGLIYEYSTATNTLTVLALSSVGGGATFSNWAINLNAVAGPRGAQGDNGATGATGAIGPAGATGPVAGSNKQFVYNNAGAPAGAANLNYDGGYVGVGISTPASLLHVRNTSAKAGGAHMLLEAYSTSSVSNDADVVLIESRRADNAAYNILNVKNAAGAKLTVGGNGDVRIANNLTVVGDLTALGNISYFETKIITSSAVVIVNSGTGPALSVTQTGAQPVATFIDKESGPALHIADTGLVGIGLSAPSERLTVLGNISASNTITGATYVSGGQELFGLISNFILPVGDDKVKQTQIAVLSTAQEFTAFHGVSATKLDNSTTFGVGDVSANWNLDTQQVAIFTLSSSPVYLRNPTNMRPGGTYMLIVKQDSTGGRVLNFQSSYKFINNVAPTVTTAPSAVDIFSFVSDGRFLYGVGSQGYI